MSCKLRTSPYAPKYVYIEVIDFDEVAAGDTLNLIIAKVNNPASKKYDINFLLQINKMVISTR